MFITRLRRKTQIRRRKGGRETLAEDAVRFQDIVVSKTRARGVAVPTKLMRELQRGSEQQDGGRRLYKLDLRRIHLTDAHVEALAEALQELPVVRKLDFRGNDDVTVRTLKALNSLLKGQVELFRLVQADASLADSSLSFLYSVKLDPVVLSLDKAASEELEAHTAALEVADSVLDVRHAFFEVDIRESGTLTEHELSDAMRIVMGSTPKAGETSRVLRFFGEPGPEAGKDPTMINLGGFEAAMVGRLRDSHTLPMLPQGCDELLFGSVEDRGDQENPECFSPWSTRSFGATVGSILDGKGSGKGGGGGIGHKRSPLSASQDLRSAAGMRTQVPPLPPWRGGACGSELERTRKDNEGEGGRGAENNVELEDIFNDDGGNGSGEQDVSRRSAPKAGPAIVRSGDDRSGREKGESSGATEEKRPKKEINSLQLKDGFEDTPRLSLYGGHGEESVLTEGSSDEESPRDSPWAQSRKEIVTEDGSRPWSDEHPNHPSDEIGTAGLSDWRRHSSGPTPTVQGQSSAGRRVSDTPRICRLEVQSAQAKAKTGATTSKISERRPSDLKGDHGNGDAFTGGAGNKTGPLTNGQSPQTRRDGAAVDYKSPHSSVSASCQAGTDETDVFRREEKDAAALGSIKGIAGGFICSPPLSAAEAVGAGAAKQRGNSSMSPPTTPDGGTVSIPAGQATPESSRGETNPTGGVSLSGDDGGGQSEMVESGTFHNVAASAAGATAGKEGRDGKYTTAETHTACLREGLGVAMARSPSVISPASVAVAAVARGEPTRKDAGAVARKKEPKQEHEPARIIVRKSLSEQRQPVEERDSSSLTSTPRSSDQRDGEHYPSVTNIAASTNPAQSDTSPKRSKSGEATVSAAAAVAGVVVPAQAVWPPRNAQINARGAGPATNDLATSEPDTLRSHSGRTGALPQNMRVHGTGVLVGGGDGEFAEERRNASVRMSGDAMEASPLEAISEGPGEASSGDGSASGDARGGTAQTPYCLSPTNVTRQFQAGSDARAATGAGCRERERLAARIQLSADNEVAAVAAAAPFVNPASQGNPSGLSPSTSPGKASGADCGFALEDRDTSSSIGNRLAQAIDVSARPLSVGRNPRAGAGSPDHGDRSSGRWHVDGGDGPGTGGGSSFSSPSPPKRFYLPSSETKTAPLCGVGGATSLFEGSLATLNKSTATGFRGDTGVETKGGGGEVKDGAGLESSLEGVLREDEEQLAIRLNDGGLVISRSGLAKMGVILELETVQERGRDCLIGLHTLVLSCNRLQARKLRCQPYRVLDISVLAAMPSLRHLDVSHNLLCRMEPMEGRDLPPRLETLNMSHNRISRIGGIGQCFLLRVVDLRNNRIKRVQGLEHLSLLEQLDLRHNLISKAASARALSFNRSLKLLWLTGNPLARHPRYRPTLTCLLPHVRSIDSRGMPPSSDSEQRRWTAERLAGEEDGGDWCNSVGVGLGGGHQRGGSSNSVSVSREWQAEQDERRSKVWRQMMEWRNDQAQRDEGANGLPSDGRHEAKQAVNAARQRRQAKELARPRARTCPSEEAISKAKEVATHRPAVVFGVSYREEKESDEVSRYYGTTAADGFGPCGGLLDGGGGGDGGDGRGGAGLPEANVETDCGEAVLFGDVLDRREERMLHRNDVKSRQRPYQEGVEGSAPSAPLSSSSSAWLPPPTQCSSTVPAISETGGYNDVSSLLPASATVVVDEDRVTTPRPVEIAQKGPRDKERASTEQSKATICEGDPLVESWLLDVRLETETAGTALRVLLKMCEEWGRDPEAERRRLSSFRTALEGMGLFSPQHGPTPTTCGADEGGILAQRVTTAAREVAMTKAAVKHLLRLMQTVGPGEDGSAELHQYTEFIRQQSEIMTGGGDHGGSDSPSAKREPANAVAAAAQQSQSVDCHTNGICGQEREEKGVTRVALTTEATACGNSGATPSVPLSPLLPFTATAGRDSPNDPEQEVVAVDTKEVRLGQQQGLVATPDGDGLLAVRNAGDVPVPQALDMAAPTTSRVAVDVVPVCPPDCDAMVTEARLMQPPEIATSEGKQTELVQATARDASTMLPVSSETDDPAEAVGENGGTPSLVSAWASAGRDSTPEDEGKGEGNGERNSSGKEDADNKGESLSPSIARPVPRSDDKAPSPTSSSLSTAESNRTSLPSGGNDDVTDAEAAVACTAEPTAMEREGQNVLAAGAAAVSADAHLSARERLLRHLRTTTSPRSGSDDDSSGSSVGGDDDNGSDAKTDGAHRPEKHVVEQHPKIMTVAQGDGSQRGCDASPTAHTARVDHAAVVADQEAGLGEPDSQAEKPASQVDNQGLTARPAQPRQEGTGTGGGETASSNDGSGDPRVSSTACSTYHLASTRLGSVGDGHVSPATPEGSAEIICSDELDMGMSDAAGLPSRNNIENSVDYGNEAIIIDAGSAGETVPKNSDGLVSTIDDKSGGARMGDPNKVAQMTSNNDGKIEQKLTVIEAVRSAQARAIDIEADRKGEDPPEAAASGVGAALGSTPDVAQTETGRRRSTTGGGNENASTKSQETETGKQEVAAGESADGKAGSCGSGDTKRERVEDATTTMKPTAELEWIEGYDPGHDCYYYHHVPTGESRWFKPDEPYEPYVHSDEEDDDPMVASPVGNELTAGTRTVTEADAALDEDDDRRRNRNKESRHSGNSDEKRHRTKRGWQEEEEERGAETTNARSSSSRRDKGSSSGRRRSSQPSKTSAPSRRRRGDDDGASQEVRSGSRRSSRQRHEKTALERLNDLTDENICDSDDLRSDDSDRGGGRKGRRLAGSPRRRDSRGSRRHREDENDEQHRS
ncbi:unnamed protein product, partial [Scytosiphon promiscuus]